jgi:hypothetical protein
MSLPVSIINCPRSGLPLAKVEALCSHGWPLLSTLSSTTGGILHPIYGFPLERLIGKLRAELQQAEQISWCCMDSEMREIQLSISATMYALDCMWLPHPDAISQRKQLEASLPKWEVCVGSGTRFLALASWFHYATSKRLSFPLYRVSKLNNNLGWENFSAWLDDAFEVKERWEKGRESLKDAEELKLRTEALLTVKAENIYKRIDFMKVWAWIDAQMKASEKYPAGRRETFKTIFLSGDMHPEDWTLDDIEDVQMAVLETCDIGNEIMHFIQKRLKHIRAMIQEFYSSFTILSSNSIGLLANPGEATEEEKKATDAFMSKFDSKLDILSELPPEPKRESFASMGLFIKAQAEWRILKRRFDAKAEKDKASAQQQASAQASSNTTLESI